MKRWARFFAATGVTMMELVLAAQGAQAAQTLQQQQQQQQQLQQPQHDMRDLTTLPRTPINSYPGGGSNDLLDLVSPATSIATSDSLNSQKAIKGKKSAAKQTNQSDRIGNVTTVVRDNRSTGQKILDSIDLYYGVTFNGPSIGTPNLGTTYNTWAQNTGPLYFYHTADFQYHFDRNNLIGVEASAKQDLVQGVTPNGWFSPMEPKFSVNDPQFWYTRKAAINTSYFSTDLTFNVWPAFTQASIDAGEYFSASFDTTWNVKRLDRRWTVYFTTRLRPYFYDVYQPPASDTFTHTEWMYLKAGYYVGYTLAPSWQVNVSGQFDADIYADSSQMWNRGDASDDNAQFEVNYFAGRWARMGVYFQSVVTNPSLVSSIVGLDITVNLLSAKM